MAVTVVFAVAVMLHTVPLTLVHPVHEVNEEVPESDGAVNTAEVPLL